MSDVVPEGLSDFLTPDAPPAPHPESGGAPPEGLDSFLHSEYQEQKYGTPLETAKALAEGVGKGLLGSSITTGIELAGGAKPEDIRGREEVHSGKQGAAEAATFLGSALLGTGEAAALGEAGKVLEGAAGLQRATRVSQMGTEAARAAFEGALYQADKEAHKVFVKDPNQSAESAIANIGISSVLGGMFGGTLGAALKPASPETFVSELDRSAFDAGDLKTHISVSDAKPEEQNKIIEAFKLNKEKAEAPAIKAAAKEIGAPVLPGMTLESPLIQRNLDALINSPYSLSGHAVGSKFSEAYQAADSALQSAISAGEQQSKAALGEGLKEGLSTAIREQYAPIKKAYDSLSEVHNIVPIEGDMTAELSKQLRDIPEFRVSPSSPQGTLVKQVFNDIKNVKTASDLKILKDGLSLPATASPQERRMVGILRDKLTGMEEASIDKFSRGFARNDEAGQYVKGLIDQKRALAPQYKEFINKVNTLSEQLGKGTVHGAEDALRFINERLTPEEVSGKLFVKKDSEFTKFFQKNFPEQFNEIRNYQRAEMIDKATRAEDGFSPKTFYNNFNKLEPETQRALYTPGEIRKIKATETYIRDAFPKNFNPSGTAHTMAHRLAHETPTNLISANIRDFGMSKAIELASKFSEGKQALQLAEQTVKGERTANNLIKGIFGSTKDLPKGVIPNIAGRAKLDKLVESYTKDPTKLVAMNDNNTSVPEYSQAFAASATRVVQYLASLKPSTSPLLPLDSRRPANNVQKSAYDKALDIAEQPLVVLKSLKEGRITSKDINALATMYPNLYKNLAQKMSEQVAKSIQKGESLPYSTRMGLSLFLGQSLDSSTTPSAIQAIQLRQASPSQRPEGDQQGNKAPPQGGMKGLQKLPGMAQTPGQQREMSRATGKH